MIQLGTYVRRLTFKQRWGAEGAAIRNQFRSSASRHRRLYFSKLRVYLAREIAGSKPAEENIYCAVLSSHGKSEQRERILHCAGRSLPNGISLFSTFLSIPCHSLYSLCSPLSTYCISRKPICILLLPRRTTRILVI